MVENSQWEKLTSEHPIFSTKFNGYSITEVQLRTKEKDGKFSPAKVELEGIKVGDRFQVLFSQHDLSCALENGTSKTCYGYRNEDAIKIGINIILYALHP